MPEPTRSGGEPASSTSTRPGRLHRSPGESAETRQRDGDRTAAPGHAARSGERERTWWEKHGGTIFIIGVFAVVVLMVVAKNTCG